jgi:hypothetical protein
MALIIETGSKVAGANSYVDVTFADTYHTTFGNADWTGADNSSKEQALIIACQSLELLYGPKYISTQLPGTQVLLWPRYPFYDRNGNVRLSAAIPVELKNAQAELALMSLLGSAMFPEGNVALVVDSESVKVGDIATSTTYSKTAKVDVATYEGFRKIDLLLWTLLKGTQRSLFLVR